MGRLRHFAASLSGRLIITVLVCILLSGAATALATALLLRGFLLQRLDQQLAEAGVRYALSLEHPADGDLDDSDFSSTVGQATGTLGARVAGGQVTAAGVVSEVGHASEVPAEARAQLAALTAPSGPRSLRLAGLGDYRLIVSAGRDQDLLITGLPKRPVDETVGRLLLTEFAVFGTALVLTGAVATMSVRRSLRPLEDVAATADRVSSLPLSSGAVTLPERVRPTGAAVEIRQVAGAVNSMLEHVEISLGTRHDSEERLRRFVADASHELRTPISVIRSYAEYGQRVGDDLPPEVERALRRIAGESQRMSHLVDDLLLLARLDAGRPLAREPVDLSRLVLDAVDDARIAGPDHRWQLELPVEPAIVTGDGHALHQALANLLGNARQHTPAGTTVTVEVVAGAGVELIVRDDGPGMPPDVRARAFERFSHGAGAGGSGLGLSIVAAIAVAHGGTADLTSRPGATVVRLHLPDVPQSRDADIPSHAAAPVAPA